MSALVSPNAAFISHRYSESDFAYERAISVLLSFFYSYTSEIVLSQPKWQNHEKKADSYNVPGFVWLC